MNKVYYTYDQIHDLVASIAQDVRRYNPTVIVAIGGGGLVPARMLKSYLTDVPVLVVTLESYKGPNQYEIIKRQWLDNPEEQIAGQCVLVVDELHDSGNTLVYCVDELYKYNPASVAVAVVHYKDKPKKATHQKGVQYFIGKNVPDQWIVYPWEVGSTRHVNTNL